VILALVSAKTALDLLLVSLVALVLLALWRWQDRREKRRRIARMERQAQYTLALLRTQREWEAAQRYRGGVVR
jgi:cytochrome oxidase assembly protein ShyY1